MAKREGEPSVKQPTVPAPHPLAELIAQMLTGVAHVPRVEQARMVADAAKAAAKWHDARVAELEANHQKYRAVVEGEFVDYERQIAELKAERDRLRISMEDVVAYLCDRSAQWRRMGYLADADAYQCKADNLAAALAAKEVGRG